MGSVIVHRRGVVLAPRREVVGRDEVGRGRCRGQRRLDAAADGLELLAAEGPVAEDAQVRDEAPRLRVVLGVGSAARWLYKANLFKFNI